MKAKKKAVKAVKKTPLNKVPKGFIPKEHIDISDVSRKEKDEWGFRKGSLSSQAIKMLASGKASKKAVRSGFKTLSFGRLLGQLKKNGFQVKEDTQGLCKVV